MIYTCPNSFPVSYPAPVFEISLFQATNRRIHFLLSVLQNEEFDLPVTTQ
jgi:hypothetical protein